eukprot:COSAG04_NODE_13202_length_616_cov_0.605416_1_plen_33_part_10
MIVRMTYPGSRRGLRTNVDELHAGVHLRRVAGC